MVDEWLADGLCWSLYLHGPTDVRKTTLAAATLLRLRETAASPAGVFVPAYRAVAVFRDISSEHQRERIRDYVRTPWLVLDDLGKHRDTPHVVEQMLMLIHERDDWHNPERNTRTIITANMDLDELAKRIDAATARRLAEGMVIHMTVPQRGHARPAASQSSNASIAFLASFSRSSDTPPLASGLSPLE